MTVHAPYHDRDAWLEARKSGIGGSDIASLFGLESAYLTPLEVWRSKCDPTWVDPPSSGRMLRGSRLEDEAARVFCEVQNRRCRRTPMRRLKDRPWILADVDRILLRDGERPATGLELKVPGWTMYKRCRDEGLPDSWILQCQHEMLVGGWDSMWVGVFYPENWSILAFPVDAVPELQQGIVSVAGDFWSRYVVPGVPPPPGYGHPPMELVHLPAITAPGVTDMANPFFPEWREAAEMARLLSIVKEQYTSMEAALKERLQGMMDEMGAQVGTGNGLRVTRVRKKPTVTKHWESLKATKPLDAIKVAALLRRAVDPEDNWIWAQLEECALDFSDFETEGQPSEYLRITVTEDDDSPASSTVENQTAVEGSLATSLLAGLLPQGGNDGN